MKDLNPANLLIAIRDHIANDVESLSVEFAAQAAHGSPPYSPSLPMANTARTWCAMFCDNCWTLV